MSNQNFLIGDKVTHRTQSGFTKIVMLVIEAGYMTSRDGSIKDIYLVSFVDLQGHVNRIHIYGSEIEKHIEK